MITVTVEHRTGDVWSKIEVVEVESMMEAINEFLPSVSRDRRIHPHWLRVRHSTDSEIKDLHDAFGQT